MEKVLRTRFKDEKGRIVPFKKLTRNHSTFGNIWKKYYTKCTKNRSKTVKNSLIFVQYY